MTDPSLQSLDPDEALEILTTYVHRHLGGDAQVSACTYREDYKVWEAWVAGVDGYVKAYIVRLGTSSGEWVCRHITVMDAPPVLGRERG